MQENENKTNAAEESVNTAAAEGEQNIAPAEDAEEFAGFDDAAEREKEQSEMDAQSELDKTLPPDPDAILEVRHLKKYFTLKKSLAASR